MIRKIVVFLIAALIGLVIQAGFVHSLYPSAGAPDFILILVVLLAMRVQTPRGVLGAFCLGVLADFASGQFVGPNAAGCVVAFMLVVILTGKVYAERSLAVIFLTFVSSIAKSFTFVALLAVYANVVLIERNVLTLIFIEACLSAIVAPLVLKALSRMTQFSGSPRRQVGEVSI